jgi:energy coupling factor transporter S component ThiW
MRENKFTVQKLTGMALLVAIGAGMGVFSIPVGGARVFPVQHAINVLAAVLYGPWAAVLIAFCVAILRNILGTGTMLAFPGGMFGAYIAGLCFFLTGKRFMAAFGEVFGTGLVGALAAFPLARFILGRDVLAYTFIIPFVLSSITGAAVGLVLLRLLRFSQATQLKESETI